MDVWLWLLYGAAAWIAVYGLVLLMRRHRAAMIEAIKKEAEEQRTRRSTKPSGNGKAPAEVKSESAESK